LYNTRACRCLCICALRCLCRCSVFLCTPMPEPRLSGDLEPFRSLPLCMVA
jgi:hypothetical protein